MCSARLNGKPLRAKQQNARSAQKCFSKLKERSKEKVDDDWEQKYLN